MGRALTPSVKAISVSQTCCFTTEPTCQSGDLLPHGKRAHKHTPTHRHPHTYKHQRGSTHRCSQTRIHAYLYKLLPGCNGSDKTNIGINTSAETNANALHTPTCVHKHLAGVEIYTRLERQASANK